MNKTSIIVFSFFLTFFQSCQTIAKRMYGIKNPKVENVASVEKYLTSIDLPVENNLFCKDMVAYQSVLHAFGRSLPEAILFNAAGKMVTYKKEKQDCNAGLFETIPGLTTNTNLQPVESSSIQKFITDLVDRNNASIKEVPKADYILFINWAKYMGKLNKDHVKVWEELANKNQNAKIKVYKINMDIMESWNVKP